MGIILLVDDDTATNFYNKYILKKNNIDCEIIALDNGLSALEYVKNNGLPKYIFLDINMPIMDGIQFLEEAKKWAKSELEKVKVFVMMSVTLPEEKIKKLHTILKVEILNRKVLTDMDINSIF
ncbi:response regulator [Algibacter sp. R77976]|uniref:response regulator n=1 Tax=Algibacter sp. R77976 TaxID=3093873 RepID=UPI0037C8AD15